MKKYFLFLAITLALGVTLADPKPAQVDVVAASLKLGTYLRLGCVYGNFNKNIETIFKMCSTVKITPGPKPEQDELALNSAADQFSNQTINMAKLTDPVRRLINCLLENGKVEIPLSHQQIMNSCELAQLDTSNLGPGIKPILLREPYGP